MKNIHMKKFIVRVTLATALFSGWSGTVYANVPVIDGAAIAQAVAQVAKLTEILQKTTGIDINSALTQVNTYKIMYDQTIRRPLQDAMNRVTIQRSADQIINMVNGSTNGNSLLVANQERFVKTAGLNSVQTSYNLVSRSGGQYSDAILQGIISATREEDPEAVLASLAQSSVPSMIQENACRDENLTQMAIYNVSQNGNVSYTQAQVQSEKQNLYGQFCNGDPRSNPTVAQRLLVLNEQNPSAGGWDTWLAKTGGDNTFTRVARAVPVVKKDAETKEEFAKMELNQGGGIASEKICVATDASDNCTEYAVTNAGSVIQDLLSMAKGAPLQTAISSLGTGADGGGFFGELTNTLYSFQNLARVAGTVGNIVTSFGGGDTNDAQINAARTPTNLTVVTGATFTADLVDNPTRKTQLISPIQNALNLHLSALEETLTIDVNHIGEANSYKQLLAGILTCYQGLQVPASVTTFYNQENQATDSLIARLTAERNSVIPSSRNYIQNMLGRLSNSNSTEEINYYNNDYRNKIDSGQLLGPTINITRAGELSTYRSNIITSQGEGGQIATKMAECASLRANPATP